MRKRTVVVFAVSVIVIVIVVVVFVSVIVVAVFGAEVVLTGGVVGEGVKSRVLGAQHARLCVRGKAVGQGRARGALGVAGGRGVKERGGLGLIV